ncbi:MAG TPA: hypothetical protein VFG62_07140 [Rhodopila sp.]|nr:hypothetical protein [Rhodopila sp.]
MPTAGGPIPVFPEQPAIKHETKTLPMAMLALDGMICVLRSRSMIVGGALLAYAVSAARADAVPRDGTISVFA